MGNILSEVAGGNPYETPKYEVVQKGEGFELRQYPPALVAEVVTEVKDSKELDSVRNEQFRTLASYIGVFGTPQNRTSPTLPSPEKISMTTPVVMGQGEASEKVAMTVPVLMEGSKSSAGAFPRLTSMQFILPSKFTLQSVPQPTNTQVQIKEVQGRKVAAVTFSGIMNDAVSTEKSMQLKAALDSAGIATKGEMMSAGYNAPFVLPFLRRNEVMYVVE